MGKYFTTEGIKKLIEENRVGEFYNSRGWRRLSHEVITEQNNECQHCKQRGKVKPATVAHHVKHLREYPELAYCRYYIDTDGTRCRQLVALCAACHEAEHKRGFAPKKEHFRNSEKW